MIALGIVERRDTFQNIKMLSEFVIAYPSLDLVEKIDITAKHYPRDVSEFEKAGLTPVESKVVRPYKVKECQVNLECRLECTKRQVIITLLCSLRSAIYFVNRGRVEAVENPENRGGYFGCALQGRAIEGDYKPSLSCGK